MTVTNKTTDHTQACLVKKVITVVTKHCGDAHCLAIAPTYLKTKTHLADAVDVTVLTVAIYLKMRTLVTQMLERGTNPFGRSQLFGYALCVAVRTESLSITKLLLSEAAKETHWLAKRCHSDVVIEAINTAVSGKQWYFAVILVKWHETNVRRLGPKYRQDLMESAAAANGVTLLRALPFRSVNDQQKVLLGLLRNSTPKAVLRYCVEEESPCWLYVRRSNLDKARSLLDLAVRESNLPLVEATMQVQAHVPRAILYSGTTQAFREAIYQNNEAMVRFFLKHGTDPEAVICPHQIRNSGRLHKSTCELARPGSKVYAMVRAAVEAKIVLHGSSYQPPSYYVWSEKEQKDVLVAYTFHPPKL
jgi:hypothetical protein